MRFSFPFILLFFLACTHTPKQKVKEPPTDYLGQEKPQNVPQIFAPNIVSVKGRFDMGISIAPDGKSIAFGVAHESDPKQTCIYLINYADGQWTSPDRSFLPDNVNTFFPMFSPNGNEIYFAKSTDTTDTDLWVAPFLDHKAITPQPLDSIFNSKAREAGHGKSEDGSFYFTSNRDDKNACCGDIYYAAFVAGNYTEVQKVPELSSSEDEESLFLSPIGDYIIIQAWKNEFESKHDLYISYRTKAGSWTVPERLSTNINSKEIEQRPFVSLDNQFLFFSRMSISQVNGEDVYESDIYWVSTKAIFKPYPYHTKIKASIKYNEPFAVVFPNDLFKDVDDQQLSYQISMEDDGQLPEWMQFNASELSLKGTWKSPDPLIIKIMAKDNSGNTGECKITLAEESH